MVDLRLQISDFKIGPMIKLFRNLQIYHLKSTIHPCRPTHGRDGRAHIV